LYFRRLRKRRQVPDLFTDADNTLWDTNAVFVEAQLELLRALERGTGMVAPEGHDRGLAFLRAVDQRLARQHPDHLRYPPVLLVSGLLHALSGHSPIRAADLALAATHPSGYENDIENYLTALRALPALREGVRETLTSARRCGVPVTVVSEERAERCIARLEAHDIAVLINDVVSAPKTVQLFKELRAGRLRRRCIMVGDQPDRDISPAKRAGFECYLYPSDFTPFWSKQSKAKPLLVLDRFDDLIPILEQS
jgi:putative hydrolase of the HAD superfamily